VIQRLPVRLMIDRAGLVGNDGPTHHGCFDLAYLGTLPDIVIMAPSDEIELMRMIKTGPPPPPYPSSSPLPPAPSPPTAAASCPSARWAARASLPAEPRRRGGRGEGHHARGGEREGEGGEGDRGRGRSSVRDLRHAKCCPLPARQRLRRPESQQALRSPPCTPSRPHTCPRSSVCPGPRLCAWLRWRLERRARLCCGASEERSDMRQRMRGAKAT
jgi:hypothetical protein